MFQFGGVIYFWVSSVAMGKPLDSKLIEKYAKAFKNVPILQNRGFSFLVDASGTLHKKSKPSLRDVEANTEA